MIQFGDRKNLKSQESDRSISGESQLQMHQAKDELLFLLQVIEITSRAGEQRIEAKHVLGKCQNQNKYLSNYCSLIYRHSSVNYWHASVN